MPKKFKGENSKAATAKARKVEAKVVADALKEQEEEAEKWQENNKHVLKKEQRKDEKEKKRLEALERKKENQRLLEEENASLKGKATKEAEAGGKVTRSQIEEMLLAKQKEQPKQKATDDLSNLEAPLEENVNRIIPDENTLEARTIEDAISMLSTATVELDRHPERRMKAAYAAFEEATLPRLKMENPNMRLAQLKQQLKKEWMKSPDNPLNQHFANYNDK